MVEFASWREERHEKTNTAREEQREATLEYDGLDLDLTENTLKT
jgi:hypothetical protein